MYAVIRSGGKQTKVETGSKVRVERLGAPIGAQVSLEPVMVVDDKGAVHATKAALAKAKVLATVVGEQAGPKINAGTYKAKANVRKRWGHRQHYSTIEITSIAP